MANHNPTHTKLTDGQRTNLQRNYFIIKMLWRIRMQEKPSTLMRDLYDDKQHGVYISRNRYSDIINHDLMSNPRLQEVAKNLSKNSGADKSIFTGDLVLWVPGINDNDWDNYFNNEKLTKWDKQVFRSKLLKQLKTVPDATDIDENLYKLYWWFVYSERYTGMVVLSQLLHIRHAIQRLTFQVLSNLTWEQLDEYYKDLCEHTALVGDIWRYKKRQ